MKRFIWTIGGFCAAAAGLLVWGLKRTPSFDEMAQHVDDSLADQNTFV